MTKPSTAAARVSPPVLSRSIDGIEFNPAAHNWRIATASGKEVFNFEILPGVTDRFRGLAKNAFAALLLANAPERLRRSMGRLRVLLTFMVRADPSRIIDEVTATDLRNYGASLPSHQQYLLRQARSILVDWGKTGVGGLSHDLLSLLPILETKNHEIGAAVRTMHPEKGPLTDIEYETVLAGLRNAFATAKLCVSDYALIVLAISLGCRGMQLAMVKIKDLSITHRNDGSKVYILQVTRLKQGKNIRPRTIFKAREIAPALGALLEQQIVIVSKWAKENGIVPAEAPLFPSTTKRLLKGRTVFFGLEGHHGSRSVGTKISGILNGLDVISARTGESMKLFQTRIRRTFGSRAAAEGLAPSAIADLMDHSWIDSCLVYIEARPEIMERIDKALALKIAPIAQAFTGTLVSRPGSGSPGRVIHIDTPAKLEGVGGCGKFEFCGLAAPLACYTCSFFNPWLDGVHEVLLERLLAERKELLVIADTRMASINDRTIFAISDVVNRCRATASRGADD